MIYRFLTSASSIVVLAALGLIVSVQTRISSQTVRPAHDPGPRAGAAAAGEPLPGLTAQEAEYFAAGKADFMESETATDGLGPRMNLDSCVGCHAQPAVGGSSPAINPQIAFANGTSGSDVPPPFLSLNGPVREARFVSNPDRTPDGGVHALFTVTGRQGAEDCAPTQPDFAAEMAKRNVIFRIPTPTFGLGLVEQIPDGAIVNNRAANAATKRALGIRGRANFHVSGRTITGQANTNGNDGTVARFGWKAQNKSLLIFSGEAYNVEMGVTNELFPTERDESNTCQYAAVPNSVVNTAAASPVDAMSSIEKFAFFMRRLAAPAPSAAGPGGAPSIAHGKAMFASVGCTLCHTPGFTTGNARIPALAHKPVNLYSDLLVHDMGTGLAGGVSQGEAGPREFRTATLWGLGQGLFFLHDGRTSDLIAAIQAHRSAGSEANGVVQRFLALSEAQKQDLLNFLRAL